MVGHASVNFRNTPYRDVPLLAPLYADVGGYAQEKQQKTTQI